MKLRFLILFFMLWGDLQAQNLISYGGIFRGDTSKKTLALIFTADEYADGASFIINELGKKKVKASFFFTGNFYREQDFEKYIIDLKRQNHYLGSHSNRHLLYCDWDKRDSLLVTRAQFEKDLLHSYEEMAGFGIEKDDAPYFLPPYEWYNDSISTWTKELGLTLINFTPGTGSNADYTYPQMGKQYKSSDEIFNSILSFEEQKPNGLNGFLLLLHFGTDPRRTDKMYFYLPRLIETLKNRGYEFVRVDELLNSASAPKILP